MDRQTFLQNRFDAAIPAHLLREKNEDRRANLSAWICGEQRALAEYREQLARLLTAQPSKYTTDWIARTTANIASSERTIAQWEHDLEILS